MALRLAQSCHSSRVPAVAAPRLATVVGVLIEVPAMLLVVGIVNRSQAWYESGPRSAAPNLGRNWP